MPTEPEFVEDPASGETVVRDGDWTRYWSALTRRWRLIALCVGIALAGAVLYSILARPLYRSTVLVDVEPDRATPLDVSLSLQQYSNPGPEFLATQTNLMQTRQIAERVVKRLNLVARPEFQMPTRGLLGRRLRAPTAEQALEHAVSQVKASIDAKPVRQIGVTTRDTNLVALSVVSPSPRLAADIANAVAEEYITWNVETRYGTADRATGYLAAQIQQTKNELDQQAQKLAAYSQDKDIVSPDAQTSVYYQRQELNYDQAVADRVAKEAKYRDLQNGSPEVAADTLSNGLVSQLRAEQAKLEREYAEKLNLFKPDWPAMRQLKAQIDNGRQHLEGVIAETVTKARESAKNEYLGALRREESLKAAMAAQKSESIKFNSNLIGYSTLKLEVDAKRALLDTLLRRQAEVEAMSRLGRERDSNIRVAEQARPAGRPFRPSYPLNGALALLLGLGFGVGLALALEYFDRSIRSVEQVEEALHLPALGVIPAADPSSGDRHAYSSGRASRRKKEGVDVEPSPIELLPQRQPRSRIAERYRAFRTSLLLSRAGGVRSIVVTSSVSQEGKTATAANLAVVLGQIGKRVLLVDADLHRPRLHEVFHVSNRTGLVSVLAEDLVAERAVVKTDVPDVFLLPSGPSSPNPSGLLSSEAMTRFLEFARVNFDNVVIDAPPVGAVADAFILGHETDGVVLCVHGGKTRRELVARVRDMLVRSNVRILGVLINNLAEDGTGYGSLDSNDLYYGEQGGYGQETQPASALRLR
jgi:polysaccharide biosynthesis transport protein